MARDCDNSRSIVQNPLQQTGGNGILFFASRYAPATDRPPVMRQGEPLEYERPQSKPRRRRRTDRELSPMRLLVWVLVGFALLAGYFVLDAMFGGF